MLHNVTYGFYVPPRRWAAHCPAGRPTQSRSWKMKRFKTSINSQIILIGLFCHLSCDWSAQSKLSNGKFFVVVKYWVLFKFKKCFFNKKPGRCVQHCEDQVECHVVRVNVVLGQTFIKACFVGWDFRWLVRFNNGWGLGEPSNICCLRFFLGFCPLISYQKVSLGSTSTLTTRICVTWPQITTTWNILVSFSCYDPGIQMEEFGAVHTKVLFCHMLVFHNFLFTSFLSGPKYHISFASCEPNDLFTSHIFTYHMIVLTLLSNRCQISHTSWVNQIICSLSHIFSHICSPPSNIFTYNIICSPPSHFHICVHLSDASFK